MTTPPVICCDDVLHWAETYTGPPMHAMLCDAPYSLGNGERGFMSSRWDTDIAFRADTWKALAQHLLPGAWGMTFASSRGWHRLACAIEDAGLIMHPSIFMLGWAFGSGFPKATRIDAAVDKAAGAERASEWHDRYHDGRERRTQGSASIFVGGNGNLRTVPTTDLAKTWAGHRYGGQVMKPALEPILVWQKPYVGKPVDCITATGAGSLWIEGGRIGASPITTHSRGNNGAFPKRPGERTVEESGRLTDQRAIDAHPRSGRWPPHLALVHLPACQAVGTQEVRGTNIPGPGVCDMGYGGGGRGHVTTSYASPDGTEVVQAYQCAPGCPVHEFDTQAGHRDAGGQSHGARPGPQTRNIYGSFKESYATARYTDSGPASRFFFTADWSLDVAEQLATAAPAFYTAKASRAERDAGIQGVEGMMQLRSDLTPEQHAYVMRELANAGVVP